MQSRVRMWNSSVDIDIYLQMILYGLYLYCTPPFTSTYTLLKYRLSSTYISLEQRFSPLYTPLSENFSTNLYLFLKYKFATIYIFLKKRLLSTYISLKYRCFKLPLFVWDFVSSQNRDEECGRQTKTIKYRTQLLSEVG